jgi:glycolate oxidase FAD binding subunit
VSDSLSIDDFGPCPVVRPATVDDLLHLVKHSAAEGKALYPFGGRTMIDQGFRPSKPGSGVDLRGLDSLVDYPARDMTVTVRAGMTVAALQAILRRERQQLPVDVPLPDQATLGGAIASNASGSRRFGHGTLRDYLIGLSIVNDRAEEVKAGGRVVKNVAGYDLMKLYTGSFGSLGIVSQVTLKVKPLAETTAILDAPCPDFAMERVLGRLLSQSATRPVLVDVVNEPAAKRLQPDAIGGWHLYVGFEEKAVTVKWQCDTLLKEFPDELEKFTNPVRDPQALLDKLRDFPLDPLSVVSWKANLLPSEVAGFLAFADSLQPRPMLLANAGNGIVRGHFDQTISREQAESAIAKLTAAALAAKGNLVVTRCPGDWKPTLPVWGHPRADWDLMRTIKAKLDPGNLFNPGRFVGGI